MTYQPDEAALLRALQARTKNRHNQYVWMMELAHSALVGTAEFYGVAHEGRSAHDIACDIVDALYPEAQAAQAESDVYSDPNKFSDVKIAEVPSEMLRQRYSYLTSSPPRDGWLGDPDDEAVAPSWPIDVPEGMAGVGYKRLDGTICPLDSEGSVHLSGWGPEKVRFLLVSVAPFFEVEYVKELALSLIVAAHQGQYNKMYDLVSTFVGEQGWTDDAEQAVLSEAPVAAPSSEEPIYDKAVTDTGSWATEGSAKEYPMVPGRSDEPTQVIRLDESPTENKPRPY